MSNKNRVQFYPPAFYALDNFSAFSILHQDRKTLFYTVEHGYQWHKAKSDYVKKLILNAMSAHDAKQIVKFYPNDCIKFDERTKTNIMKSLLILKLEQHEYVRKTLWRTFDMNIEENSPRDKFWGTSIDGSGKNVLGNLWMELRNIFKKDLEKEASKKLWKQFPEDYYTSNISIGIYNNQIDQIYSDTNIKIKDITNWDNIKTGKITKDNIYKYYKYLPKNMIDQLNK